MQTHFEVCDNLSVLYWPIMAKLDAAGSFGGTFSYQEEKAYEDFHREYLLPSAKEGLTHLTHELNNRFFTVTHINKRNFSYHLEFDDGSILMLTPTLRKSSAFGKVIIPQPAVWEDPFDKITRLTAFLKQIIGNFIVKPDSMDLAVHVSGWDITQNDSLHWTGNFRRKKLHPVLEEKGVSFSGFEIGSKGSRARSPFCRVYDKTMQLRHKHGLPRPYLLYSPPVDEKTKIWNIEFSFNSRCLKSFNIKTPEQLQKSKAALWKHATTKYIRHKAVPRTSKKFKRADISNEWKIIQNCHQVSDETINLIKNVEKKTDVSGLFQLNKMKKRLMRYALIKNLPPEELRNILDLVYEDLTNPSRLGSLCWKDYVTKHFDRHNQLDLLIHGLDL